jgi:hypothetical protein
MLTYLSKPHLHCAELSIGAFVVAVGLALIEAHKPTNPSAG